MGIHIEWQNGWYHSKFGQTSLSLWYLMMLCEHYIVTLGTMKDLISFFLPRSCQLLCVHCSHFKQQLTLVLFYVVVGTRREPPLCCMTIATTSNWFVPEMAIRRSPPSLLQLQPTWNRLCYNFIASFCGHHMRLAVAMSTPTLTLHQETLPDYNASTMVAMDVSIYLCRLREVVRRLGFQGVLWEKSLVRQ